jgi:hypothetical protein
MTREHPNRLSAREQVRTTTAEVIEIPRAIGATIESVEARLNAALERQNPNLNKARLELSKRLSFELSIDRNIQKILTEYLRESAESNESAEVNLLQHIKGTIFLSRNLLITATQDIFDQSEIQGIDYLDQLKHVLNDMFTRNFGKVTNHKKIKNAINEAIEEIRDVL